MIKVLIPWCVLLLTPALAHAQSDAESYQMTDGKRILGDVMSVDGDTVKMKIFFGEGSMSRVYPLADFTPTSNYAIRAAVVSPTDADANLALARYAASTNQVAAAKRSLAAARKIAGDPSLGGDVAAEIKVAPARKLEADFRNWLEKGQMQLAERTLKTLRVKYSDVVPADKLHALEDELEAQKKKRESEIVAAKAAKEDAAMVAKRERALKPLQKGLSDAQAYHDRAMQNSKNSSNADSAFSKAIRLCDLVLGRAKSLTKEHANDAVMGRELQAMDKNATDLKINCLLSQASVYTVHGRLNAALGNVNKVLLVDPGNRQAMAMRGRIETAANDSGWGW